MEIEDYIVCDERDLAQKVIEGDNLAFEHLFNRYREAIYNLFVQKCNNADDADDLLQETFIKVYVNIHRYSREYTFGQWVYTIARNTFVDFVRKRQDDISLDERNLSVPASSAPNPEESIIASQQMTQIERNIESLPDNYKLLIRLRFMDELSYEEIAERLHLPLGTVKTQIHRARERMCRLIRDRH